MIQNINIFKHINRRNTLNIEGNWNRNTNHHKEQKWELEKASTSIESKLNKILHTNRLSHINRSINQNFN